jgi:FlaA1/EpsC-like NDP-sugar epimerase
MISGGSRLFIRIFREYMESQTSGKRTLIIGAGDAGEMIVRDMKHNPKFAYEPIGFIDDNRYKKGLSIHGVPIFGPRSMMGLVIEEHKPEEILISLPSASLEVIRETYEICKPYNIPIKTLPKIFDILDGKVSVSQIKSLSLEDLLEREPVRTDIKEVRDYISGKPVLVTGAGGSIGSELCRQIFKYNPSHLIMFDRYENSLFDIDYELQGRRPKAGSLKPVIHTVVGDILDNDVLEHMFSKHRPSVVFHAAAHKHVPLMEKNPLEAVKNNIFGTKNILEAASRHHAENFVMVSTDKAVNPTSIMGATKRVAEFLTMNMNGISSTRYTTVRFGNVLGSNGSVVEIFKKQLKNREPLTVTHPDIKRYFMLIPEAVQLVLIAASSGKGGDLFVLDMGEQIKLTDFAENLIRLSGFIPYEDIKIEFSGLRPGEKLYEELFNDSERSVPSSHEKLRIAIPEKIPHMSALEKHISQLKDIISNNTVKDVIPLIQQIVPNYQQGKGP